MTSRPEPDGSAGAPPRPRRVRRWLKIGAIIVALLVFNSFFDFLGRVRQAMFPDAGWYGYTQSLTPVDLELRSKSGVTRLRIPKAYLTYLPNWRGGLQELVKVEVAFPAMQPYSRTRVPTLVRPGTDEAQAGRPPQSRIYITLDGSRPGAVTERIAREVERWEFRRVTEDGLRLYYDVQRNPDGSRFNPNKPDDLKKRQFVVPAQDGRPMIHLECPPTKDQHRPWGCMTRSNLGEILLLKYIFDQRELPRWREVDRRVRELVASFIVESAPAPPKAP